MRRIVPLEERFWEKVKKTDYCWEWTAALSPPRPGHIGYGVIGRGGRGSGNIRAHVLSYELHSGQPIPDGQVVRHTCDNPPCVNPDHLVLGSFSDNMRDAAKRKRIRNQNTDKTHCHKGHSLHDAFVTYDNHNVLGDGIRRSCRECKRLSCAAYRVRRKERET